MDPHMDVHIYIYIYTRKPNMFVVISKGNAKAGVWRSFRPIGRSPISMDKRRALAIDCGHTSPRCDSVTLQGIADRK